MKQLNSYEDALVSAILHRFFGDIMESLKWSDDPLPLSRRANRVQVPLRADVAFLYEKGLAGFTIEARVHDRDDTWYLSRVVFSTRELRDARDRAELISYLFEQLKDELIRRIAEGELNDILGITKGNAS